MTVQVIFKGEIGITNLTFLFIYWSFQLIVLEIL